MKIINIVIFQSYKAMGTFRGSLIKEYVIENDYILEV